MLIEPGESREVHLPLTEAANSRPVLLPITVIRGKKEGLRLLLVAALHGDELNGTAILREILSRVSPNRLRGTLIIVPVLNVLGFLYRSRYLPDRRDLNRYFPGSPKGNMAQRIAHRFFQDVVKLADACIDLHTAAAGRENFSHIRGDMRDPAVRRIAKAFGSPIIIDEPGPIGSLRRAATREGIPSIVFEGGTANKFERPIVRAGLHGIENLLRRTGTLPKKGNRKKSPFQVIVRKTHWIRSDRGGILELKIHPGSLIYRGDPVAVISNPLGRDVHPIPSPMTGLVIAVTTNPVINPGTPIAHVVQLRKTLATVEKAVAAGTFKAPRL